MITRTEVYQYQSLWSVQSSIATMEGAGWAVRQVIAYTGDGNESWLVIYERQP